MPFSNRLFKLIKATLDYAYLREAVQYSGGMSRSLR